MNKTVTVAALMALGAMASAQEQAVLNQYRTTCHNEKIKTAGLMLDKLDFAHPRA